MLRFFLPVVTVTAVLVAALPDSAKANCTLIADAATREVFERTGDCETPLTPASSFKLPLAVMGFDASILTDADHPVWAFQEGFADWMDDWKTDVSPRYWLEKSVVWYSQELTRKLGMEKFQGYIDAFDYGNRDLSGDPGKDNGLSNAWLRSSLKISPDEQAGFLDRLINRKLGVAASAYDMTMNSMPKESLANGWVVSGKTGSSFRSDGNGAADPQRRQLGWYVGWAEKDARKVIFVNLIVDETKQEGYAGPRAKAELLGLLPAKLDSL